MQEEGGGGLLERIPPELLSLVLTFLEDAKDVACFACTCSTTRDLVQQDFFVRYAIERKKEGGLAPVPVDKRAASHADKEELGQPWSQELLPLFLGGCKDNEMVDWRHCFYCGVRVASFSFLIIHSSNYTNSLNIPFRIRRLAILYAMRTVPTFDFLCEFDAILVIGGGVIRNNETTSNLLARYIKEDRGGVVIARAANQKPKTQSYGDYCVKGDFLSEGLHPLIPGCGDLVYRTLGATLRPNHPTLHQVEEIGQVYRCQGVPEQGAEVIAEWDDGVPLVVQLRKEEHYGMVVTVNAGCEVPPVGGSRLLSNALAYVALSSNKTKATCFRLLKRYG
ncbi:hypothetical protein QOT17_005077 [Balamuthia mandrillaris]